MSLWKECLEKGKKENNEVGGMGDVTLRTEKDESQKDFYQAQGSSQKIQQTELQKFIPKRLGI